MTDRIPTFIYSNYQRLYCNSILYKLVWVVVLVSCNTYLFYCGNASQPITKPLGSHSVSIQFATSYIVQKDDDGNWKGLPLPELAIAMGIKQRISLRFRLLGLGTMIEGFVLLNHIEQPVYVSIMGGAGISYFPKTWSAGVAGNESSYAISYFTLQAYTGFVFDIPIKRRPFEWYVASAGKWIYFATNFQPDQFITQNLGIQNTLGMLYRINPYHYIGVEVNDYIGLLRPSHTIFSALYWSAKLLGNTL